MPAENAWTTEMVEAQRQKVATRPRPAASAPPRATNVQPAKPGKHRSRKTVLGGITFDSAKEAKRWQELSLLQQVGAIRDLRRQVSYDLWACNGERIARYICDFVFWDIAISREVREDTKSEWTKRIPLYRIKAKLMAAQGTPITET